MSETIESNPIDSALYFHKINHLKNQTDKCNQNKNTVNMTFFLNREGIISLQQMSIAAGVQKNTEI